MAITWHDAFRAANRSLALEIARAAYSPLPILGTVARTIAPRIEANAENSQDSGNLTPAEIILWGAYFGPAGFIAAASYQAQRDAYNAAASKKETRVVGTRETTASTDAGAGAGGTWVGEPRKEAPFLPRKKDEGWLFLPRFVSEGTALFVDKLALQGRPSAGIQGGDR